jgi:hypothetical protein
MTPKLELLVIKLCQGTIGNLESALTQEWIQSMKALVDGLGWEDENEAFATNSLEALATRCKRSLQIRTGVEFITMFNMLNLAAKTNRCVFILLLSGINKMNLFSHMQLYGLTSVDATYEQFLEHGKDVPTKLTFRKWVANGTKFACFAGAGKCHWLFNYHV